MAEGPSSVLSGLIHNVVFQMLFVDEDFLNRGKAQIVNEALAKHPKPGQVRSVSSSTFAKMSGTETPQGVLLVLPFPFQYQTPLKKSPWQKRLWVVGCDLNDPGNVGTLIRSSAGAGVWGFSAAGDGTDPFSPKCVRASAGAIFTIPVSVAPDSKNHVAQFLNTGASVYKTVPKGGLFPWDRPLHEDTVLVVGNEAHGLPKDIENLLPLGISVPMPGGIESLNVAAASTVILYEAVRQRLTVDP